MLPRKRILIHPRWWLTKLFSFHTPGRRRRVPPVLPTGVGPLFSGANAGSTLRPRPGLRHMYSLVSVKTFSTHAVFIFRPIVCVENVLVRTGISHTLEWKRSQKGHVSTLKSSRDSKPSNSHYRSARLTTCETWARMRRRRRRRLLCWCGRNHLDLPRREPQE